MTITPTPPVFVKPELVFEWQEYIVFTLILASSMGIGIFYGFFGSKNKTNEEFLMAGRSMGILPVTLSLICSFISAVALLGYPVEVYLYGTQYTMFMIAFGIMTILLAFIYVPVYIRLQLTSAYEYFEWRFSRRVRILCSISSVIYLLTYMPITVFAPSLALDQVAGINQYISSAAIFIVCIAYSSIGGLKAVLWTDALQAVVMLASLFAIIIGGIIEIGGVDEIIRRNSDSNRIMFFNMDFDPRTRHTFWSCAIGGVGFWLPVFGATQAQIQRYNSVPNLRTSRITLVLNMVGLMLVVGLTSWIGMTIYAMYYTCDPLTAGIISSADQLLPLFVMEVLGKYPGIPGLLVGGLTCGTLSSVSSALNALTATITEDFVKYYRPNIEPQKLTMISKIISASCGLIAFFFIFPIAIVNDTIQMVPFATLMSGCLMGPVFGAFTLGMFFPWANEIGIFIGFGVSVLVCGFQGLGQILASRVPGKLPDQRLYLTTDGCEIFNGTAHFLEVVNPSDYVNPWKERDDPWEIQFWSISYAWPPGLAIGTTIVFGLIFSTIVNLTNRKRKLVEERLFAYPVLQLWKHVFGEEYLQNWILPAALEDETSKKIKFRW